jgi:hypothetical protein
MMAIQFSIAVRNARLDAIESTLGATAKLSLYSGSAPADCATAASGTLLATLTLPADYLANASAGSKLLSGTWSGIGAAAGTAGYFRLTDNAGTTTHLQGTVAATGADLNISPTAAIGVSQAISITGFTLTEANA